MTWVVAQQVPGESLLGESGDRCTSAVLVGQEKIMYLVENCKATKYTP